MNLESFGQGYTHAGVGTNPKRLLQFIEENVGAKSYTDAVDMFWGAIPSTLAIATPH